ncbi:MAG: FmdB family zinc ribbon protein [Bacteroidota bacterium]|jgi:putative FmdB family regulatory protein
MPLYEYLCKNCGVLEVIQGIKDEPLKNCPNCDKEIERQFPLTSKPQFKGKGFYETDYKSNKKT